MGCIVECLLAAGNTHGLKLPSPSVRSSYLLSLVYSVVFQESSVAYTPAMDRRAVFLSELQPRTKRTSYWHVGLSTSRRCWEVVMPDSDRIGTAMRPPVMPRSYSRKSIWSSDCCCWLDLSLYAFTSWTAFQSRQSLTRTCGKRNPRGRSSVVLPNSKGLLLLLPAPK